jgi:hypothetical protein
MTKNIRKAAKVLRECRSFKGDDFDVVNGARSSVGNYAKRKTRRASRRLDKALAEDTN